MDEPQAQPDPAAAEYAQAKDIYGKSLERKLDELTK